MRTNFSGARVPYFQQQPADGQHRQEGRRHDVHGEGEVEIALFHPVDVALCAVPGGGDERFIAALRLAEDLDDLDAADILHRRVVEGLGGRHGALVILLIAQPSSGRRRPSPGAAAAGPPGPSASPGKGGTSSVASAAAALLLISGMACASVGSMLSTRSTRMFFSSPEPLACTSPRGIRASFASPCFRILPSTAKVALWDCAGRQRVEQYTQKPERRHHRTIDQIACKVFVSGQQLADDLRHHKERQNLKRSTDDSQASH